MPNGNSNAKNVNDDTKSNFSNVTTCSSSSQGELSIYEIDILSYGNSKGKSDESFTCKSGKNWKIQNESFPGKCDVSKGVQIPLNPLIKSHYPLLETLRVESDLNGVKFEIDSEKKLTANETHHKHALKEKLEDKKYTSLDGKKSKEKLKAHLGKGTKANRVEEIDGKIKKSKRNLKELEKEFVHFHHHEHHHYHLNPSKHQDAKEYSKRLPSLKKEGGEKKKKKQESEDSKNSAANISSTATYVCLQPTSLSLPKIDPPLAGSINITCAGNENPHIYLPMCPNNIDSLLEASSDLIVAHTFSPTDLSEQSDKCSIINGVQKKLSDFQKRQDSTLMIPRKATKQEYNELAKTLKKYDKDIGSRLTAKKSVKVSCIQHRNKGEKIDEVDGLKNNNSGEFLGQTEPIVE